MRIPLLFAIVILMSTVFVETAVTQTLPAAQAVAVALTG